QGVSDRDVAAPVSFYEVLRGQTAGGRALRDSAGDGADVDAVGVVNVHFIVRLAVRARGVLRDPQGDREGSAGFVGLDFILYAGPARGGLRPAAADRDAAAKYCAVGVCFHRVLGAIFIRREDAGAAGGALNDAQADRKAAGPLGFDLVSLETGAWTG